MATIIILGICTGLATVFGAQLVWFFPIQNRRCLAPLLGAAAGIMIGLSLFGLLPEGNAFSGVKITGAGFVWGIFMMRFFDMLVHRKEENSVQDSYIGMGVLIAVGIALHNFPEGLAMGAGFRGGENLGYLIAFSLMLHNIPEGATIGAPLKTGGFSLARILWITALAGIVTPMGAACGWILADVSARFLGAAMGVAAGAMVYISFDSLIPAALRLDRGTGNGGVYLGILLTFMLQSL